MGEAMKTCAKIEHTLSILANIYDQRNLSEQQRLLFYGMSVALCWVINSPNGSALQDIIDGREIVARGNTISPGA
jgi:hypothetical protein